MSEPPLAEPPLWQALVAGSFGGFCAATASHPFDTVKVRMQVNPTLTKTPPPLFRSLYSGFLAQCAGIVPFWATFYYGYKLGRRIFPDEDSLLHGFLAGAVAGAAGTPAVVASETIKTLAQVSGTSSGAAMRDLLQSGLRAASRRVLSVVPLTLFYMMPSQGVFYATYEVASARSGSEAVAGGFAGLCEWTSSLPVDTVRARVYVEVLTQGHPPQPVSCARRLWSAAGPAGFYEAIGPTLLRAITANAAALGGIEWANRWLTNMRLGIREG